MQNANQTDPGPADAAGRRRFLRRLAGGGRRSPRLAGLDAAPRFHDTIDAERVEKRADLLRRRLVELLRRDPRVRIVSPGSDALSAGMVAFSVEGTDSLELQRRLARAASVRTRVIGEYDYGWMRLSPHIYDTPEELERVAGLIGELA